MSSVLSSNGRICQWFVFQWWGKQNFLKVFKMYVKWKPFNFNIKSLCYPDPPCTHLGWRSLSSWMKSCSCPIKFATKKTQQFDVQSHHSHIFRFLPKKESRKNRPSHLVRLIAHYPYHTATPPKWAWLENCFRFCELHNGLNHSKKTCT